MSKPLATYVTVQVTDVLVLIADPGGDGRSVTNDAESVVARVDREVGGLGARTLYYRDSAGQFDRLQHDGAGRFVGFAPCTRDQQSELARLLPRALLASLPVPRNGPNFAAAPSRPTKETY